MSKIFGNNNKIFCSINFQITTILYFIFLVFTLSKPENVVNRTKNGSQFEFYARLTEKQGQVPKISKSSY